MSRFFSLFLTLFLTFSGISFATENNIYLVEGVTTNFSGKSPSVARGGAIASARRSAFLVLLTRLEIATSVADTVSNEEISDMVRSEQIDGEKIAGNSYSATLNILFAKDFVDYILGKKDLKKSENLKAIKKPEEVTESYLLIPAKITKRSMVLWEEENDWKRAIEKNLSKKSQKKFIIPNPDLENVAIVNSDNVALADYATLEPMLFKYKANGAYSLFFSYDEIENKVNINTFRISKSQKKQVKLSFVNVDRLSYEALMDKVASKTIDYLISSQNSEDASLNLVRIQIPITSLGKWLMVKRKIENSNMTNQLNIESISRDYGFISMNYANGRTDIFENFLKVGLSLSQKSENFYVATDHEDQR
jgi:hypothetical protein